MIKRERDLHLTLPQGFKSQRTGQHAGPRDLGGELCATVNIASWYFGFLLNSPRVYNLRRRFRDKTGLSFKFSLVEQWTDEQTHMV